MSGVGGHGTLWWQLARLQGKDESFTDHLEGAGRASMGLVPVVVETGQEYKDGEVTL